MLQLVQFLKVVVEIGVVVDVLAVLMIAGGVEVSSEVEAAEGEGVMGLSLTSVSLSVFKFWPVLLLRAEAELLVLLLLLLAACTAAAAAAAAVKLYE